MICEQESSLIKPPINRNARMSQRLEGLPSFDGFEPCLVGTPYPEDHKIIVNVRQQIIQQI